MNRSLAFVRHLLLPALLVCLPMTAPAATQQCMVTTGFQLPLPLLSVGCSYRASSSEVTIGAGAHLVPIGESLLSGAFSAARYIPSGKGLDALYPSRSFSWVPGLMQSPIQTTKAPFGFAQGRLRSPGSTKS